MTPAFFFITSIIYGHISGQALSWVPARRDGVAIQPGSSADIYSLPPSIIKTLSFIFAHNYMRRYGSYSPALNPSGEGPCLPNRAELVWGPGWLENPARGPCPYLVERWWWPQPPSPFSAELEPPWSLLASMGSAVSPHCPRALPLPLVFSVGVPSPTFCLLVDPLLFGIQLSYHHLLVNLSCLPGPCSVCARHPMRPSPQSRWHCAVLCGRSWALVHGESCGIY